MGKRIRRLRPLPDRHLPRCFSEAVRLVRRPYLPVTEGVAKELEEIALRHRTDFFLMDDVVVTWGTADSGYALMPLADQGLADGAPEGGEAYLLETGAVQRLVPE